VVGPIFMVLLTSAAFHLPPGDAPVGEDGPDAALTALAGVYDSGISALTVTREGRFSVEFLGCGMTMSGVNYREYGGARLKAGHLILTPEQPIDPRGPKVRVSDLVPVRWGERQYLVLEEYKKAFCNGVNSGDLNAFHSFLRRGDKDKKASGMPVVPKEWVSLLLKKPIDGKIIEVFDSNPARLLRGRAGAAAFLGHMIEACENPRARVNLGTERGVWKGMRLWVDPAEYGLLEVLEVDELTCIVALARQERPGLRKGQEVKSKRYCEGGERIN
jgi:hypothetical protein